jgi:hypothetical protein
LDWEDKRIPALISSPDARQVGGVPPAITLPMGQGRMQVMIPYEPPKWANREWIHAACGRKIRPVWNREQRYWEIARSHFPKMLDFMLRKYGRVHIFEDHSDMEICNGKCQHAEQEACVCRCLGKNHGIQYTDNLGMQVNPRRTWHCIDEDTEVLLGFHGVRRVHFIVNAEMFKPIAENEAAGYVQYSYGKKYPVIEGECFICEEWGRLYTDHCHYHGWVRGKICPRCNVQLGWAEKGFRDAKYEIIGEIETVEHLNQINQLLKMPRL